MTLPNDGRTTMSGRRARHGTTAAIKIVAALLMCAVRVSADAIVTRHDVPPSKYLVGDGSFPPLADLPMEGQGVLIAKQWVITAAHATLMMRTMRDHDYATINGERRHVAQIIVYPDYLASADGWDQLFKRIKSENPKAWMADYAAATGAMHDIALIKLTAPVEDVTPVALYRSSGEHGHIAQLYGKGATGTDLTGAAEDAPHRGPLRAAYNRITGAHAQWVSYTFDCGRTALPLEGVVAGGDSGGPVLIEDGGQWKLAGLAHGLDGQVQDVRSLRSGTFRQGTCGQRFISTRISFYAPWIDKILSTDPTNAKRRLK